MATDKKKLAAKMIKQHIELVLEAVSDAVPMLSGSRSAEAALSETDMASNDRGTSNSSPSKAVSGVARHSDGKWVSFHGQHVVQCIAPFTLLDYIYTIFQQVILPFQGKKRYIGLFDTQAQAALAAEAARSTLATETGMAGAIIALAKNAAKEAVREDDGSNATQMDNDSIEEATEQKAIDYGSFNVSRASRYKKWVSLSWPIPF